VKRARRGSSINASTCATTPSGLGRDHACTWGVSTDISSYYWGAAEERVKGRLITSLDLETQRGNRTEIALHFCSGAIKNNLGSTL